MGQRGWWNRIGEGGDLMRGEEEMARTEVAYKKATAA